jgi:hypothetical protein
LQRRKVRIPATDAKAEQSQKDCRTRHLSNWFAPSARWRGDEKYGDELRKRADEFSVELAKVDLPADKLLDESNHLKSEVDNFLASIRAA